MSKSYVIQWKSALNGRTGTGTKLFEMEQAQQLADELNREYPHIHHEAVAANLPDEPSPEPPSPQPAEPPQPTEPLEASSENSRVMLDPDRALTF